MDNEVKQFGLKNAAFNEMRYNKALGNKILNETIDTTTYKIDDYETATYYYLSNTHMLRYLT